jgi:hypothetical protein
MEDPIRILDHRTRQLRRRIVDQVKVQWDNCSPHSTIWEDAYEMHQQFSYLFDRLEGSDKIPKLVKGEWHPWSIEVRLEVSRHVIKFMSQINLGGLENIEMVRPC